MNRLPVLLLVLAVSLCLPGCDSSPTQITDGPRVFEGTIGDMETLVFSFVVTRSGGVRIEATSIIADPPPEEGAFVAIGVGIGEFDSAGECIGTVSSSLTEGQRLALGLAEKQYCLRVFDGGTVPVEETRTFVITVSATE